MSKKSRPAVTCAAVHASVDTLKDAIRTLFDKRVLHPEVADELRVALNTFRYAADKYLTK